MSETSPATGQLPEMTSGERVALIQQRIRDVQKRWTELKIEVAHLDRKRRRARRKEREGEEGGVHLLFLLANLHDTMSCINTLRLAVSLSVCLSVCVCVCVCNGSGMFMGWDYSDARPTTFVL